MSGKRHRGPLRKIAEVVQVHVASGVTLPYELLECGHSQPVKEDIYGPTNAERRRCRRCIETLDAALGEDIDGQ